VITLEVADLVLIASRTLGLDTGQVLGLLDPAAEHALTQAQPGGQPGRAADRAAALPQALVRQQPLRRGNQQVALAAMLQFMALNGGDMDPDLPRQVRVHGRRAPRRDAQHQGRCGPAGGPAAAGRRQIHR
jgi:hypothetical protein